MEALGALDREKGSRSSSTNMYRTGTGRPGSTPPTSGRDAEENLKRSSSYGPESSDFSGPERGQSPAPEQIFVMPPPMATSERAGIKSSQRTATARHSKSRSMELALAEIDFSLNREELYTTVPKTLPPVRTSSVDVGFHHAQSRSAETDTSPAATAPSGSSGAQETTEKSPKSPLPPRPLNRAFSMGSAPPVSEELAETALRLEAQGVVVGKNSQTAKLAKAMLSLLTPGKDKDMPSEFIAAAREHRKNRKESSPESELQEAERPDVDPSLQRVISFDVPDQVEEGEESYPRSELPSIPLGEGEDHMHSHVTDSRTSPEWPGFRGTAFRTQPQVHGKEHQDYEQVQVRGDQKLELPILRPKESMEAPTNLPKLVIPASFKGMQRAGASGDRFSQAKQQEVDDARGYASRLAEERRRSYNEGLQAKGEQAVYRTHGGLGVDDNPRIVPQGFYGLQKASPTPAPRNRRAAAYQEKYMGTDREPWIGPNSTSSSSVTGVAWADTGGRGGSPPASLDDATMPLSGGKARSSGSLGNAGRKMSKLLQRGRVLAASHQHSPWLTLQNTLICGGLLALLIAAIIIAAIEMEQRSHHSEKKLPGVIPGAVSGTPSILETPPATDSPPSGTSDGDFPVCYGACCSNIHHSVPPGMASMPSMWWSNNMTDGAQVQLRSLASNLWLGPLPDAATWNELGAFNVTAGVNSFFTVHRYSASKVRLRTPDGKYMVARRGAAVSADQTLPEPATLFTVIKVGSSKRQVQLQAFDGRMLTMHPNGSLVRSNNLAIAETFEVREVMNLPSMRGVNLGNWLLVEEWMDEDLFRSVPTLIDGLRFQLRSEVFGTYVSAAGSTDEGLVCETKHPSSWEMFYLRTTAENGKIQIRAFDYQFWTAESGGGGHVFANQSAAHVTENETFSYVTNPDDRSVIMIQAANGMYLEAHENGSITATKPAESLNLKAGSQDWQRKTAFRYNALSGLNGEWQLCRSLGPVRAAQVLESHMDTFITEADFAFLSGHNVNAVRIPIGYWTTMTKAPYPFPTGSLRYLDRAFTWGQKYGIGIWISMHGAPFSQNGFEHSGSRDGIPEWAANQSRIDQMVDSVAFLAARYSTSRSLLGIGLLNEPLARGVPLNVLKAYYIKAYDAVREHSGCAFVSLQSRVGARFTELKNFMEEDEYTNTILETHFYNLVNNIFQGKDINFNVDYVLENRTNQIQELQEHGRLAMVGEWSLATVEGIEASNENNDIFGSAQLKAYSEATAGWFFWNYKINRVGWSDWSFRESLQAGWLKQKPTGGWT